jgi:signal transduction histidine kinase
MEILKQSKLNYVLYIILATTVIWLTLFSIKVFIPNLQDSVSSANQIFESIIHVFLILLGLKIYTKLSAGNKVIFKWFIITNIFFFLNDAVFYLFIYLPVEHIHFSKEIYLLWKILLNNIPFIVWLIAIIIFLSKILIRDIISKQLFFKIMVCLIGFNLIVITLFLLPVGFYVSTETIHNLFLISGFFIESIIFDLAILCLVYSKNKGISLILSGFIVVITGDFLITYCWLAKIEDLYGYGSLLWFLGMILIFWGILSINYYKSYDIKLWFRSNGSIKSKVSFWAFGISATSFLLFFIIAYVFSFISKQAFIALPVFVMFYTIFVICLSVYMGETFEVPFKQIENNINAILINSEKEKIDTNFSIDEFIFLQKFIINAFKSKEEQDLIRKKFGDLAAEVAHDVASPLTAMNIAVSNLKQNNVERRDIAILEKAMLSVKNITNNLLVNYRNLDKVSCCKDLHQNDDGNIPRYIILASFLVNLIEAKQIEWSNEPCDISIKVSECIKISWIYVSPLQLSRTISNLLNNAYESLDKNFRKINIALAKKDNYFELTIKDNGCGIPAKYLKDVLLGKSLKHTGTGMGMSGARKYLTSIGGSLSVNSIYKEETCVTLNLPMAGIPVWFSSHISCDAATSFVVLDDDPSVIMLWQQVMARFKAECKYFLSLKEFDSWFQTNENTNTIFLVDYDLRDSLSGIEIIQKYGLNNVYMCTNHAEEIWLQEIVVNNKFKLVPKSVIPSVQIVRCCN